ncbi:MAG: hypothetical protein HOI47_14900 [Candidatus Scalindua sp.]|nr:hypothetical protein [Candidatus Scalindua sp.]
MGLEKDKKLTVFIAAYRSFSVRYLLYTDVFKYIQGKELQIVLILRDTELEYYREKFNYPNVVFEPFMYETAYSYLFKIPNSKFLVKARRHLYSINRRENTTAKFQFAFFRKISGIRSCIDAIRIYLSVFILSRVRILRKALLKFECRLFDGRFYDGLFEKYKPALLITSSIGHNCDAYIMRAAKRWNCKTMAIIHSWDNTTSKGYKGVDPDYVVAWHKHMKEELVSFHDVDEKTIHVGGIAHWDYHWKRVNSPENRKEFFVNTGLSMDKKVVFLGLSNPKVFRSTLNILQELLEKAVNDEFYCKVQFLVRIHPMFLMSGGSNANNENKLYMQEIKKIEERYKGLVKFNFPEMPIICKDVDMPISGLLSLSDILRYSDVMITQFSTLMIEAAIYDLPIINAGIGNLRDTSIEAENYKDWMHVKRIVRTKACKLASNIDELCTFINMYLEDRSRDSEYRKLLADEECSINRGCAGKKIAEYIFGNLNQN